MKLEFEFEKKRMKPQMEEQRKAKLHKLQISNFVGTVTDWVRFREQFEEEIDKCKHYAATTKFLYLREQLSNQPESKITGLPFTEQGY